MNEDDGTREAFARARDHKRPEGENCVGCEYHNRCAGAIGRAIGYQMQVAGEDDGAARKWCHNWWGWHEEETPCES